MNVEKNLTTGEDDNYFEQLDTHDIIQTPSNGTKDTYSTVTKAKTLPKVFEFKLKIANDAKTIKLTDNEFNKVVRWANQHI